MRCGPQALIIVVTLLILGCATAYLQTDVKSYADPDNPPAGLKTFKVVPLGLTQDNPLLEKELLYLVKHELLAKGLTYDDVNPDALVGLSAFIGPFEEYVPPATFHWPMITSSSKTTTTTGTIGMTNVFGTSITKETDTQLVPITRPGRTRTRYYRNIQVVLGRPTVTADGSSQVELVWSGVIESTGDTSDLVGLAPTLIDELLGEFPERSGKPVNRHVPLKTSTSSSHR
jgi:hypothetical protein